MIALLLAILCSASIALLFRYSEDENLNRYAVTTANYIVATLVSVIILSSGDFSLPSDFELSKSLDSLWGQLRGNAGLPERHVSFLWAIAMGAVAGVWYFLAFVFYQRSVRRDGVSLAGAFGKLGILLPLTISLLAWNESLSEWQWIGILIAAAAILVLNLPQRVGMMQKVRYTLLLLLVFGGLAEFSNKLFQKYGLLDDKTLFLFCVFGTALICAIIATVLRQKVVTRRDLIVGAAVGIPNLFSSFFLIEALNDMPAAVVFSVFGAATIAIIQLGGAVIYKERLSRRERIVLVAIMVSVVLANL